MISSILKALMPYIIFGVIISIFYQKYNNIDSINKRLHKELINTTQEFEKINDYAAKLKISYVEQAQLKEQLKIHWKSEKDSLNGRIKVLSNATFLIREHARKSDKSDIIYKGKKIKYILNELRFNNGPPIGYVLIFDNGNVVSKIYNHKIKVETIINRNEDTGKYNIASKAQFILKAPSLTTEKNWYNKPHLLKIEGGTALIDPTEKLQNQPIKFHVWVPSLNAGIDYKIGDPKPSMGVSFMGYGRKRDLDWKFIQFGYNYSAHSGLGFTFTPALYRPLPKIFKNTYIGAGIGQDRFGMFGFIGLQIEF